MTSHSDAESKQFIGKMTASLMPLFHASVLPIFGIQDGNAKQCGTGTLFRVADRSFLVTAAHVADIDTKYNIPLQICDSADGAPFVGLFGHVHSHPHYDVAVWELPVEIVRALPNRKFLSVHHTDRVGNRQPTGWYYIHGYPTDWSACHRDRMTASVKPITYGTTPSDADTSLLEGFDPEIHILLDYDETNAFTLNGAPTEFPMKLSGISGSSIWQAFYPGLPAADWTENDAVVVGVQTGVYRGNIVKATKWWVIDQMLKQQYPDLQGPLSILTPYERTLRKVS